MYILYYLPTCPFCRKVLDLIEENDGLIKVVLKNISETENLNELMEKGGERKVPFFIDTEENFSLYESDEIIEYINKRI